MSETSLVVMALELSLCWEETAISAVAVSVVCSCGFPTKCAEAVRRATWEIETRKSWGKNGKSRLGCCDFFVLSNLEFVFVGQQGRSAATSPVGVLHGEVASD